MLAALLFVLTIVWTFAGSAMEKSRHGSIPLEDYTAPCRLPPWTITPGQPTALDADAAPDQFCAGAAVAAGPDLYPNMKPTARPARMGCVVHYM